jgi:uncharacterized C2H2 Zn-finger protein
MFPSMRTSGCSRSDRTGSLGVQIPYTVGGDYNPRVPLFTLPELLALAQPVVALDACAICAHIPGYCSRFEKAGELVSDNLPAEVGQLEGFIDELRGWRGCILRCPTCHRLYRNESEYEYLVGGSEDTYSYERVEPEEVFRSDWYTRVRVADQELVGNVLDAACPQHRGQSRHVNKTADQTFYRRHCLVELELGTTRLWLALPDDGTRITILTGNLDGLARLAAVDPPGDLEQPERATGYAALADTVTSEHPPRYVSAFDDIPWRTTLDEAERMYIEDLRAASRVEPPRVECHADRCEIQRWLVDQRKLVCRVLTVLRTGEVLRADAVIGDHLPIR